MFLSLCIWYFIALTLIAAWKLPGVRREKVGTFAIFVVFYLLIFLLLPYSPEFATLALMAMMFAGFFALIFTPFFFAWRLPKTRRCKVLATLIIVVLYVCIECRWHFYF